MVWVACVVCGWCCVLVVFCMACSSHHFVHTKPPPLSPFPFPSPPHSSVSVSLSVCGKGGGPQSGWCGMECGVWHATHQPLCFHQAITNPCVSLVLHHSLLTLKLLLFFFPSFLVWFGFVWTERVKDKCGTHHVKHTVHHIQSTPHSFHPITPPLFNEHMVDWFVMHQNTFHASMVLCPLLLHKPFPPHSCFAIPFHHSTHQPPLLFSFSLFPFHSLSQHSFHATIQHSFTPSMCSL